MRIILFSLTTLVLGGIAIVHIPSVQDMAAAKLEALLESKIDAKVNIGRLRFNGLGGIAIHDLVLIDPAPYENEGMRGPDTLLRAGTVGVKPALLSLAYREDFLIKDLTLKDVDMRMAIEDNLYHSNLKRMLRSPYQPDGKTFAEKRIFTIRKFTVRNFNYSLRNLKAPHKAPGKGKIDWKDIQVYDLELDADHFSLNHGIFEANVTHGCFREKSGIEIKSLTARADVGKGNVKVSRIQLCDAHSQLNLDLNMAGRKRAYQHFLEDVVITADIREASVDTRTISYFVPTMKDIPDTRLTLHGKYYGSVAKMMFDKLKVDVEGSAISTTINGGLYGLPDKSKLSAKLGLTGTTFRTDQIQTLLRKMGKAPAKDLGGIGKGQLFRADIYTDGSIQDLNLRLKLRQGNKGGAMNAKLRVQGLESGEGGGMKIDGHLESRNLDLGKLLGKEKLGLLSAETDLSATLPHKEQPIDARLSSIKIDKMHLAGYTYEHLSGSAALQGKDVTADLEIKDKALEAELTLWSSKYEYNASMVIGKADLHKLGLDKRDSSRASLMLYAHLDKDLSKLKGNAVLSEIFLTGEEGTSHISDVTVNADNSENRYNLSLDSDFITASFVGNRNDMRFSLNTFDTRDLLAFIMPGIYVESGTSINAAIDTDGNVSGSILSGRLAKGKNNLKNLQASISGTKDDAYISLMTDGITLKDITILNNSLRANLKDRKCLTFDFSCDNAVEQKRTKADIHGQATLEGRDRINAEIRPSKVTISGEQWDVPLCRISKTGDDISIDNLALTSGNKSITLDGGISGETEQELKLGIRNLDLSRISSVVKGGSLKLGGVLNATGSIHSPFKKKQLPYLALALAADSVSLSGNALGSIKGSCSFVPGEEMMNIALRDSLDGTIPFSLEARLNPGNRDINGRLSLNAFPLHSAQPLFSSLLSDMDGTLHGVVDIQKDSSGVALSSSGLEFEACSMTLALTGVKYSLSGKIGIDNKGLILDGLSLRDRFGNSGSFRGGLKWDRMNNMRADLRVNLPKIEILNMPTGNAASKIYGNAFVGALANISGPLNDLEVSLTLRTLDNSTVHTRITNNMIATKHNLLTFINPFEDNMPDLYTQHMLGNKKKRKEGSRLRINARAIINPEMLLFADMEAKGLNANACIQGRGDITVNYDSNEKGINLLGDYAITDGSVNAQVSSLVKRDFTIKNGSSITFGGDLMQSIVDLEATYQTKASIGVLIADTTSVANRRVVNCGILIKNKIANPNINFSIDIPDLDPSAQAKVESALSTDDKIQKQFLSLLISNNFLPDDQGGIINNSSMLYSNMSEIMSNQINNIFNRLDIPLDLGFHYQRTDTGSNMFDVALNTQLWNNRIIIGGTVGNRKQLNTANESIFGDFDIQLKLIPSGSLRLKAFSHSADQYSNYLDNSQRNGLGITWQQEFDSFRDWVRRLFSKKETKQKMDERDVVRGRRLKTVILDEN